MKPSQFLILIAINLFICGHSFAAEDEKSEERLSPGSDSDGDKIVKDITRTNIDDKDRTEIDKQDSTENSNNQESGSTEEINPRVGGAKVNLSIKENPNSLLIDASNSAFKSKNTDTNENSAEPKSGNERKSYDASELNNSNGDSKDDNNLAELGKIGEAQGPEERSGIRHFTTIKRFGMIPPSLPPQVIKPQMSNSVLPVQIQSLPSTLSPILFTSNRFNPILPQMPPPLTQPERLNPVLPQIPPSLMKPEMFNPKLPPTPFPDTFSSQQRSMERFKPSHSFETQFRKGSDEMSEESSDSNAYPFASISRTTKLIPMHSEPSDAMKFRQTPPPPFHPIYKTFEPFAVSRNRQLNIPDGVQMPNLPYFHRILV